MSSFFEHVAQMDSIQVLGKELRGDPDRARNELAARAAAASVAWRLSGAPIFTLEGVLRGQGRAGCEIVQELLIELGVPESHIVARPWTCSTREEVLLSKKLLGERGGHRLGVVTSAYHVARSRRYFAQCGVGGWVHAPEAFLKRASVQERAWILSGTPSADALLEEAEVERRLNRVEALLGVLPEGLSWRAEVQVGRLFRALRREWVAPEADAL
ncbi:MAG: YdcF family protein [Myxococcota bacterium]|nr:YdcF family protein [Myxococcota bacterium]